VTPSAGEQRRFALFMALAAVLIVAAALLQSTADAPVAPKAFPAPAATSQPVASRAAPSPSSSSRVAATPFEDRRSAPPPNEPAGPPQRITVSVRAPAKAPDGAVRFVTRAPQSPWIVATGAAQSTFGPKPNLASEVSPGGAWTTAIFEWKADAATFAAWALFETKPLTS
jgi:hypothetical protein